MKEMEKDSSSIGHGAAIASSWWSPGTHPSPSTDVMNQLCRVCGEPAAGFHFGAFTCEGCKSFFGRTYNNLGSITECKNNGECVINKKNRTACKACRLRKCLLVGMSKSGSRYGRRSNWFKIHCLLQEQQQAVGGGGHLNDKSALALWGENYRNLSIHPRFDSDGKHASSEELANNNNNTLVKEREKRPSSAGAQQDMYSAEAAAALWAAKHSLFPMHHHLPPLSLPYLSSFTNFHTPTHSNPQRNTLLPFIDNFQMASISPHHVTHQLSTLSPTPSRSSSDSSRSRSQSPNPINSSPASDCLNVKDNPGICNVARTRLTSDVAQIQENESQNRASLPESRKTSEENSLAMLRSLGPVQDQPMDLSVRVIKLKHRRKSIANRRMEENCESDSSDNSDNSEIEKGNESDSKAVENSNQIFSKRKKPLDLTKTSKLQL